MGRVWLLLLLVGVSAASDDGLVLHAEVDDVGDSFLEMTTTTMGGADRCHSVGDTHVGAFDDIQNAYFDVMGEKEWVLTEGPDDDSGAVPKWFVQGVQKIWQRCGTHRPDVTIMKTLAFQCGSFYMLVDSPWPTHDCHRYASLYHNNRQKIPTNYVIMPRIWMRGTVVDGNTDVFMDGSTDLIQDRFTAQGYTTTFRDGTGSTGQVKWTRNKCNTKTCRYYSMGGDALRFEFKCAGTRTEGKMQGNSYTYFDTYVYVPKNTGDNPPISVGRQRNAKNGNLIGGYCGGWSQAASNVLQGQHNTCRNKRPRSFYIPSGDNTCETYFTTNIQNSVFAFFEGWSNGAYDSKFGLDEAKNAAEEAGIDQAKVQECTDTCIATAQRVSGQTYREEPTTPKEKSLQVNVEECADDCYFGLDWDDNLMREELCDVISRKLQNERNDIYCAAQLLHGECDKVIPTGGLLSSLESLKSTADINTINTKNAAVTAMTTEVHNSGEGINYWYDSSCAGLMEANDNFDVLSCNNYQFKDTSTDMSRAGFTSVVTHISAGTKNKVSSSKNSDPILVEGVFNDPVIFLGPPSFTDSGVVVARSEKVTDGFRLFLGVPTCGNPVHSDESVSYMILEKGFNYGDAFKVVTASVGSSWTTINFPEMADDGDLVSVLAHVQTTNNQNNDYLYVRLKSLASGSVQARLMSDELTEEQGQGLAAETVAFLVMKGDTTSFVKGLEYKRGTMMTSTSTSVGGAVTGVVQQASVPDVDADHPPTYFVALVSGNTATGSVNMRTTQTGEKFKFKLDEDQCKDQNRGHGQETALWLALSA